MHGHSRCYILSALAPAPELVDLVFSHIDSVLTLGSLITTCRLIHGRFAARKAVVISRVLQNELGPAFTDANFLCIFPYRSLGDGLASWFVYHDEVHIAAGTYIEMLQGSGNADKAGRTTLDLGEITRICHTSRHINYLADAYIGAQLRLFGAEEGPGATAAAATKPPSQTERQRVLRAVYRRQIISNAWAPTERAYSTGWFDEDVACMSNPTEHDGGRLRPGIMAPFEIWELQQVDHIDYFIKRFCAALWIASEEAGTEAGGGGGPPFSEAEFGDMLTHVDCLVRCMQTQPQELVDKAIQLLPKLPWKVALSGAGVEQTEYVVLLQRYSIIPFCGAWQHARAQEFPIDAVQESGGQQGPHEAPGGTRDHPTVDFAGDAVDLVPFGWVDALSGRIIRGNGEGLLQLPLPGEEEDLDGAEYQLGEEEWRRNLHWRIGYANLWRAAGFAFWDRTRVEAIKMLNQMSCLRTGWILQSIFLPGEPRLVGVKLRDRSSYI